MNILISECFKLPYYFRICKQQFILFERRIDIPNIRFIHCIFFFAMHILILSEIILIKHKLLNSKLG